MMFLSKKALETIKDEINDLQKTISKYVMCKECGGLFVKHCTYRVMREIYLDDDTYPTTYDTYYCKAHKKNYNKVIVHEKDGNREEKFYRTIPGKEVEVK